MFKCSKTEGYDGGGLMKRLVRRERLNDVSRSEVVLLVSLG